MKSEVKERIRAKLIGTVMEISIGLLLVAVLLGKVALPTFYAVATTGFDAYTVLIWGIIPLVAAVAVLTAVYNRAKYAYQYGGAGGYG